MIHAGPLAIAVQAAAERISQHCEEHSPEYSGVGGITALAFMADLTGAIQLIGLALAVGTAAINAATALVRYRREQKAAAKQPGESVEPRK
jgi:hypothetical protein